MMQWTGADREFAHLLSCARHFQLTSIEIEVFPVRRDPPIEHAFSSLTILVQGSDLEQRPLAFNQVLNLIRTIRSKRRRPVTFIGISRTGLTTNIARQIARTIAYLPTNTITGPVPLLEMQKVVERDSVFISSIMH
jgi:hypothetical protein